MQDLPPLNALAPFDAVVRLGSMTRAAEELQLTHSAVSKQVASLERHLGRRLFDRVGRGLVPTREAHELAIAVSDALDGITAACRAFTRTATHPLVVSCEPTLLQRWLLPRLRSFDAETPLHLSASGGPVEFRRDGIDAAVRRRDFAIARHVAVHPLFAEWVGPVCSPDVAERICDGGGATRLVTRTRPRAWDAWLPSVREAVDDGEQVFEHFFLTLQAATAGLGVAIGAYPMVADDLGSGLLVAPWGFAREGAEYVMLTPQTPHPHARSLYEWMRAQTGVTPPDALRRDGVADAKRQYR